MTIDLVVTSARRDRSARPSAGPRGVGRLDASRRHRAGPGAATHVVPGGDRGCGPKGDRHRDVAGEPLQIPVTRLLKPLGADAPDRADRVDRGEGRTHDGDFSTSSGPQVVAQPPRRPRVPKGYPLEHLVGAVRPDRVESVAEGRDQVARGDRRAVRPRRAHGRQAGAARPRGPRERRVPARDGRGLRRLLRHGRRGCGPRPPALDAPTVPESARLWRELLGPEFMAPADDGGFARRTAVSTVASTGRYG